MKVSAEEIKMWTEVVVTYWKILSRLSSDGTEKKHETLE
jgi:hypothetical protein